MLSSLLWIALGLGGSLLAAVRAQLVVLERDPSSSWLAAAAGLAAGGLVLAVGLSAGLGLRSPRKWVFLLLFMPVLALGLGAGAAYHFPARHFKSAQVQSEWGLLHPALRLALWVVALEDRDLVVTDIVRESAGYARTGMGARSRSRHVRAEDGYVRAVDLRVARASPLRNWARQGLFLAMGMDVVRHGGTGDHLHISIPV